MMKSFLLGLALGFLVIFPLYHSGPPIKPRTFIQSGETWRWAWANDALDLYDWRIGLGSRWDLANWTAIPWPDPTRGSKQ